MSVFKPTGSQFYTYSFRLKGRRYHGPTKTTSKRKAEAVETAAREAAALEIAREARGEVPAAEARPKGKVPTLDAAALTWWTMHGKALGRGEKDERHRESRLARAVQFVGKDKLVTALRTADIAEAIQKRRAKLVKPPGVKGKGKVAEPATVNRDIIETIRPVIYHACAILEVSPPPIKWGALRMKTPKPKARDFTKEAMKTFYDLLPGHWQDFARFEARYGARVGEMFFHPEDVEIGNRHQVVLRDRKADDDLVLPLLPEDAKMLAARKSRAIAAGLDTVWFRQLKGGRIKALTYNGAKWAIREAIRKAGLRGAKGSHDLRHQAAMTMLRATGNIRTVQSLLGHADLKSTMVYAHALKDDVLKGLEAVKEAQGIVKADDAAAENTSENKAVGE